MVVAHKRLGEPILYFYRNNLVNFLVKDDNNILEMDTKSQEYKDSLVSGFVVPGVFNLTNELDVTNIYRRRFYRKMDRHGKDSESDIKKGIYS